MVYIHQQVLASADDFNLVEVVDLVVPTSRHRELRHLLESIWLEDVDELATVCRVEKVIELIVGQTPAFSEIRLTHVMCRHEFEIFLGWVVNLPLNDFFVSPSQFISFVAYEANSFAVQLFW